MRTNLEIGDVTSPRIAGKGAEAKAEPRTFDDGFPMLDFVPGHVLTSETVAEAVDEQ